MSTYNDTATYWDKIFQEQPLFTPTNILPYPPIEESLRWIGTSKTILDFGCGSGRVAMRCLDFATIHVTGIDVSEKAIQKANSVVSHFKLEKQCHFVCGNLEWLKTQKENSFEGGILYNILDNMYPNDSKKLIQEFHRVVKPQGKILIKLNDYYDPKKLDSLHYKEIEPNFYKEASTLYLWNISESEFSKVTNDYFTFEQKIVVEFKEYNQKNRIYYMRNK